MAKKIGLWTITILSAALFAFAGGTKLAGAMGHPEHFAHWGLPLWFMYVTGAVEVVGALLLLLPSSAAAGALVLGATMLGAVATHAGAGELPAVVMPLVLLALVGVIGYARRAPLLALLPSRRRLAASQSS